MPENEHGAFLIRDSESRHNDFSLSGECFLRDFYTVQCYMLSSLALFTVRDGDTVKHYRIRQLDEGGFFIARRTTFRTLQELVEHYTKDADGLCVSLNKPCIQVILTIIIYTSSMSQFFMLRRAHEKLLFRFSVTMATYIVFQLLKLLIYDDILIFRSKNR